MPKIDIKQTENYRKAVEEINNQIITKEILRETAAMAWRTRRILESSGL